MVTERTLDGPVRTAGIDHAMNETVDRLVLDVVDAVDDGYTGVPESQRLIAWLGADFLPYSHQRFPQAPVTLVELRDVLDQMHGSNGRQAADLAVRARSLVLRLL